MTALVIFMARKLLVEITQNIPSFSVFLTVGNMSGDLFQRGQRIAISGYPKGSGATSNLPSLWLLGSPFVF